MTTLAQKFLEIEDEYPYLGLGIIEIDKFEAIEFFDDTNGKQRIAIAVDNSDDITHAILALFEYINYELSYSLERTDEEHNAQYYDGEGRGYRDKNPCGLSGGLIVSSKIQLPSLGLNGHKGDFPIFMYLEETKKFVRVELEDIAKVES